VSRKLGAIQTAVEQGVHIQLVLSNYTKDGRHFWNRLEISPIHDAAGKVIAFVGVQSDITDERRRDQALAETQRMEALGTMAGNIAHEINNWIQPTLVAKSLLTPNLKRDVPEAIPRYLARLEESALHIRSIVQDILNFAKGEEDEETLSGLNLRRELEAAIAFAGHLTPPNLKTQQKLFVEEDVTASLSKTGLAQIVTNLITNASHAMDGKGGVVFEATLTEIDPKSAAEFNVQSGSFCRLRVTDTGPGFSAEILTRAFEPFITSHRSTGGTGLGLSVIRGIVASWGGFVEAENAAAGGARITLFIPVLDKKKSRGGKI